MCSNMVTSMNDLGALKSARLRHQRPYHDPRLLQRREADAPLEDVVIAAFDPFEQARVNADERRQGGAAALMDQVQQRSRFLVMPACAAALETHQPQKRVAAI